MTFSRYFLQWPCDIAHEASACIFRQLGSCHCLHQHRGKRERLGGMYIIREPAAERMDCVERSYHQWHCCCLTRSQWGASHCHWHSCFPMALSQFSGVVSYHSYSADHEHIMLRRLGLTQQVVAMYHARFIVLITQVVLTKKLKFWWICSRHEH